MCTDGSVSNEKLVSSDLWTKKYRPRTIDRHCINSKKKEEFVKICTQDYRTKILILQGPSGSGKNSLIDCFGEQNNFEIVRFKDEKSKLVSDVYGDPNAINSQEDDDG